MLEKARNVTLETRCQKQSQTIMRKVAKSGDNVKVVPASKPVLVYKDIASQTQDLDTRDHASQNAAETRCSFSQTNEQLENRAALQPLSNGSERIQCLKNRGDKWKKRCRAYKKKINFEKHRFTSNDGAWKEKVESLSKSMKEKDLHNKNEIRRLEACLAGSEAARKEIARLTDNIQDSAFLATRAANAEAHAAELKVHLMDLSSSTTTTIETLKKEKATIENALAKEKADRARIITSLRGTIGDLKESGNQEGKLKLDNFALRSRLAHATAAKDRFSQEAEEHKLQIKNLYSELTMQIESAEESQHKVTMKTLQLQKDYARLEVLVSQCESHLSKIRADSMEEIHKLQATLPNMEINELENRAAALAASASCFNERLKLLEVKWQEESEKRNTSEHENGWWRLMLSRRCKDALTELKAATSDTIKARNQEICSLKRDIETAHERASLAENETSVVTKRVEGLQKYSEEERQTMARRHLDNVKELERSSESEKTALWEEAKKQINQALAEGVRQGIAQAQESIAQVKSCASKEISAAEAALKMSSVKLEEVRGEFTAFKLQKIEQVEQLQARLKNLYGINPRASNTPKKRGRGRASHSIANRSPRRNRTSISASSHSKLQGENQVQDAAAEIQSALEDDTYHTDLKEADFERMEKLQVLEELEALQEVETSLRIKLKASHKEIRLLKDLLAQNNTNALEVASQKSETERIRSELSHCQESLRIAKNENNRRQKNIQTLQEKLGNEELLSRKSDLAFERSAKEAAESKLCQLKATIGRKDTLIRDLRKKLDEMGDLINTRQESEKEQLLPAAEAKIKQLQASLNRKDLVISDLRDKLESAASRECNSKCKALTEKQANATKNLRRDLQLTEAKLKDCQQLLEKAEINSQEKASTLENLSSQAESSIHRSGEEAIKWNRAATSLVVAVEGSTNLLLKCCRAMVSAAQCLKIKRKRVFQESGVNAAAIASMVDLSAEEVEDLLTLGYEPPCASCDKGYNLEGICKIVKFIKSSIAEPVQQGSIGLWAEGATKNLLSSLEREVLRSEEELKDSLFLLDQSLNTSRVSSTILSSGQPVAPKHRLSAERVVANLEAELARAEEGFDKISG